MFFQYLAIAYLALGLAEAVPSSRSMRSERRSAVAVAEAQFPSKRWGNETSTDLLTLKERQDGPPPNDYQCPNTEGQVFLRYISQSDCCAPPNNGENVEDMAAAQFQNNATLAEPTSTRVEGEYRTENSGRIILQMELDPDTYISDFDANENRDLYEVARSLIDFTYLYDNPLAMAVEIFSGRFDDPAVDRRLGILYYQFFPRGADKKMAVRSDGAETEDKDEILAP